MDKDKFYELISRFNALSVDEVNAILEAQKKYPYCQILHLLVARGSKDHDLPDQKDYLHRSAIYCTHRSILKNIITSNDLIKTYSVKPSKPNIKEPPSPSPHTPSPIKSVELSTSPIEPVDLSAENAKYNEVIYDLEQLNASMKRFEQLVSHIESKREKPKKVAKKTTKRARPVRKKETKNETKKKKVLKRGRSSTSHSKKPSSSPAKTKKRTKPSVSSSSKKQVPPSETKTSIDPEYTYTELNQDIASETLVDIFVKQGKNEPAINLLKKLIWKYPLKRTYFANRINSLQIK